MPANDESYRVLLVEDDEEDYMIANDMLARHERVQFVLDWAKTYEGALAAIGEQRHDVYLIDYRLGGRTGFELVREGFAERPHAPVIMLTGQDDRTIDLEASALGVTDFLVKGELDAAGLERSIRYAVSHHKALRDLALSEERYSLAVRAANDGIWDWDVAAGRIYFSTRWYAILGLPDRDAEEHPDLWLSLVHDDDLPRVRAAIDNHILGATPQLQVEHRMRHADGAWRWVLNRGLAIRDREGVAARMAGSMSDITDRKLAEQAEESARVEAERANRAKSEFLSRMSHELRTPLNAVIGFGQLLELDDLDARQREGVELILKAGRHLLELINEVLDISRIESGATSISLEPVHLGSVLAEALSLIRPMADEAQVRLIADPTESADLYVRADQQRLKQVLINLLSNAVKYNRAGGEITVRCDQLPERRVVVAVTDTGHGMSADQLGRLFEPFDRLGAENTSIEGTGLGLSLSKGLIEAMGGTISCDSEPHVGTTMSVELDLAAAPPAMTAAGNGASIGAHVPPTDRRTILYIEDNFSNLQLVERVLARIPQARLIPAMQGKLGIDLARQHQPDLIILDLHLPDIHGREVLAQLKHDPATEPIPIVIISADATPAQVSQLRACGAADYLTKPIDIESFLSTVTAVLKDTTRVP